MMIKKEVKLIMVLCAFVGALIVYYVSNSGELRFEIEKNQEEEKFASKYESIKSEVRFANNYVSYHSILSHHFTSLEQLILYGLDNRIPRGGVVRWNKTADVEGQWIILLFFDFPEVQKSSISDSIAFNISMSLVMREYSLTRWKNGSLLPFFQIHDLAAIVTLRDVCELSGTGKKGEGLAWRLLGSAEQFIECFQQLGWAKQQMTSDTCIDVNKCLAETNVDGVMSAQALLKNPALFCGQIVDLDRLAFEYLELAEKYPGADDSCMRAHLFKILYTGLAANIGLRERMTKAWVINCFREIVAKVSQISSSRKEARFYEIFASEQ